MVFRGEIVQRVWKEVESFVRNFMKQDTTEARLLLYEYNFPFWIEKYRNENVTYTSIFQKRKEKKKEKKMKDEKRQMDPFNWTISHERRVSNIPWTR